MSDERAERYADAIRSDAGLDPSWGVIPEAVCDLADSELVALRAEVENLRTTADMDLAYQRKLEASVMRVEALADWFEQQENWRAWNVHGQIRTALAAPATESVAPAWPTAGHVAGRPLTVEPCATPTTTAPTATGS
jgi:hypothetical protein